MTHLTLSLLGPLQVALDAQPVTGFAYNKARALLAYLAVEADHVHQRDAIVGLLWPDMSDAAARTNLRQVLASLRDAIGAEFLLTTRDSLQFNPASDYDLDVMRFTSLLDVCAKHPHRHLTRCPACAARQTEAVTLYRGDFLLQLSSVDSSPFEEWLVVKREALHQRAVAALANLAHYHERWGDVPRARQLLARLIELEPWDEPAYVHLMHLLAIEGKRSAALTYYETCRRMLAEQFGVEPAAATKRLYDQIRDGQLMEAVTPTRSIDLPIASTKLIGREAELADLAELLADPARRLITLVGPGGIGKTRLALAALTVNTPMFEEGAAFVNLAGLSSADLLAATILSVLNQPIEQAVSPEQQLINYLRGRELLLVLDNFEHLLDGVELIIRLLRQTAKMTLLITSRERLALQAEQVFDLNRLSLSASEQLFLERVQHVQRKFQWQPEAGAIARICRLVEGLPLAIELAASTVGAQTCAAIADDIAASLRTLVTRYRDLPERHRSLWAAFEHSWRLLSSDEQRAFSRLAVFRGSFDRDAAQAVADTTPDTLAALIDQSLVQRETDGRLDLHELLRQYAHEKLNEAGQADQIHAQHLAWFLDLAQAAEPQLRGKDQAEWLHRLAQANDDLRAALTWSLEQGDIEAAAELSSALWQFWWTRGYLSEGRRWLGKIQSYGDRLAPDMRARLLNRAAVLAAQQGDFAEAQRLFEANLALNRERGSVSGTANTLNNLGALAIERANYDQARVFLEECLPLRRQLGNPAHIAATLNNLGTVAHCLSDLESAQQYFDESMTVYRQLEDTRSIAGVLNNLGGITLERSDADRASALYRESLTLRATIGDQAGMAECLEGFAAMAVLRGQSQQSARLYGAAAALREQIGAPLAPANEALNARFMTAAQTQLGEAAWASAVATGRTLSLEQMISHALTND